MAQQLKIHPKRTSPSSPLLASSVRCLSLRFLGSSDASLPSPPPSSRGFIPLCLPALLPWTIHWMRRPSAQLWPGLNRLHLQWLFLIRSHPEGQGLRTLAYVFWGDTTWSITRYFQGEKKDILFPLLRQKSQEFYLYKYFVAICISFPPFLQRRQPRKAC